MISETNMMIGFDTLSESDTRREEKAYTLAQRGSKELVKLSCSLLSSERPDPPPCFVLTDPESSQSDFNRLQRGISSHILCPSPSFHCPSPLLLPFSVFLFSVSILDFLSLWMRRNMEGCFCSGFPAIKWFLMIHCSYSHNMYFRVNESSSTWPC